MQSEEPRQSIEDLANALQVAVLLAAALDQTLHETPCARESRDLIMTLERAARAAGELRRWAQSPPVLDR